MFMQMSRLQFSCSFAFLHVKLFLRLTLVGVKIVKVGMIHQIHITSQLYSLTVTEELDKIYGKMFK